MNFFLVVSLVTLFFNFSLCTLNCPPLPPHVATNISDLRPNDIKVVMALGDSITAAFGLVGTSGGLNEYRGQSFSIGADPNATTLFNFLKTFSPDIQGGSVGVHLSEFCYGPLCPPLQYRPELDVLNSAQSGAMSSDLPSHEMSYLLKQLAANPKINMKTDWKVLTILIGANDLCLSCLNRSFSSAEVFETNLRKTLEDVRTSIPRVFVNLMEIFNISQVYTLSLTSPHCSGVHRDLPFECECAFATGAKGDAQRLEMDEIAQAYNARIRKITADYAAKNYQEFAVIDQPMGRNTAISSFPVDYLSTLDCFHPSLLAHQNFAMALWDNMLTPAAKKQTAISPGTLEPVCPTADTRLYIN